MIKFLLLLVVGFATASFIPQKQSEWEQFKAKYNKIYTTPEEENMRKGIFMRHLEEVEEAGKAEPKISNGFLVSGPEINGFADITWDEYQDMYHLRRKLNLQTNFTGGIGMYEYKGKDVPKDVNLFKNGIVLPARNQGSCGVCWAFSAAASLEGLQAIQSGKAISLSPTNIFECAGKGDNCDSGADAMQGIDYSADLQGLDKDECYPYTYADADKTRKYDQCKESSSCKVAIKFENPQTYVIQGDDAVNVLAMREVVSVQPVSIAITWNRNLSKYKGDSIFYADAASCDPKGQNHAINVIGYGTTADGNDYWLVKNSHGTRWGKDGFGAIARGFNVCGMETHIAFPNGGLI